jgi:hypothetical protein
LSGNWRRAFADSNRLLNVSNPGQKGCGWEGFGRTSSTHGCFQLPVEFNCSGLTLIRGFLEGLANNGINHFRNIRID